MQCSIVIPAHNEAQTIERHVATFLEGLDCSLRALVGEVLIVENGSTDHTADACSRLERLFPVVRMLRLPRGSYGEAIKLGMLESKGTHVTILECDFLDSRFLAGSIDIFKRNKADFVVGSKRHKDSTDSRPLKRRALTFLYNQFFLKTCLGYPGTDTHGLKSVELNCAKRLCRLSLTTDEVFQTEIVLLAWKLGLRIEEIPVEIAELRSAPVSVVRRVPKVLKTVRDLRHSLRRFEADAACNALVEER